MKYASSAPAPRTGRNDPRSILEQIIEVLHSGEHLTPHELASRLPHVRRWTIGSVVGASVRAGGPVLRETTPCGVSHFGPFYRCFLSA